MKLLGAILALMPLASGELRQLWEIRLDKEIKEPAAWPRVGWHVVQAVAFSPNGKQVAVTVDDHETTTAIGTHVVVVDVQDSVGRVRQYDVDTCGAPLQWSPGGEALPVCSYVLNELWLDSQRIARATLGDAHEFDADCRELGALSRDQMEGALLKSERPLPSWPPAQLAEPSKGVVWKVVGASNPPTRVLAERYGESFSLFRYVNPLAGVFERYLPLQRRIVWDIPAAREIASWKPKWEPYRPNFGHGASNAAISPDGRFVVEGGDGRLRLYRLD